MEYDKKVKNVWSSLFTRKGGGDKDTRLWDEWNEIDKNDLFSRFDRLDGELGVLLWKAKSKVGCITTQRIIFGDESYLHDDLCEVNPLDFGNRPKEGMNSFEIKFVKGNHLIICVNPGTSYFSLWAILQNILARSKLKNKN